MEDFNKYEYLTIDGIKKLDRDRKITTILWVILISILFIFGIITCISSIKFNNKVVQEYDKCVKINEEMFCKVEK